MCVDRRYLTALVAVTLWLVATANPDAKRLYDDLLSRYNRLIRPVGNNSDTITVKMGLRLSQLIDVRWASRGAGCKGVAVTDGSPAAASGSPTDDRPLMRTADEDEDDS
ncbi:Acetylcholine receptor subunit alpha-like 1 [Amphibalanus amphitrite]|uniref:Acetylcholine receptor subunit alpha-like 1 n=1 Tax=Amphibalanus amphitrite TaxID=1232801 RepID=A0A6A4W1J9_AMPAM|nr:Acetylcholine receptor subunit alpha-like 1 [Amphibalanus amphitrite]